VKVAVQLERLGAPPEAIAFEPRGEYLAATGDRGAAPSEVTVAAERGGKRYRWEYEQAEGRVKMTDAAMKRRHRARDRRPARIRSMLQLQGEIQFNGDRVAHVVPRLAGVVVRLAKNLGTRRRSELLITPESQTLADLRSERLAALTRLELCAPHSTARSGCEGRSPPSRTTS
jgi:cobalt-zinc-cadmium efflux system membrane fusion protein